jgi:hypothetical protein
MRPVLGEIRKFWCFQPAPINITNIINNLNMAPPNRSIRSVLCKDYRQMNNPLLDDYLITNSVDSTVDSTIDPTLDSTANSSFSISSSDAIDANTTTNANS